MNTKTKHIPLNPVTSSQVEAVGYDAATKTLAVKFIRTPATYNYHGVEPEKFAELQAAKSVGSFVHQHFVKSKAPFTNIPPVEQHA